MAVLYRVQSCWWTTRCTTTALTCGALAVCWPPWFSGAAQIALSLKTIRCLMLLLIQERAVLPWPWQLRPACQDCKGVFCHFWTKRNSSSTIKNLQFKINCSKRCSERRSCTSTWTSTKLSWTPGSQTSWADTVEKDGRGMNSILGVQLYVIPLFQVCAQWEPAFGVSRDSWLPRQTAEVPLTFDIIQEFSGDRFLHICALGTTIRSGWQPWRQWSMLTSTLW